ncbi:hypothetical protein FWC31_01025 [Candidatus Saccharibacteria bacterium]|nr:hypothetical protein [Candidatus Saccharibacteria bacterium]
MLECQLTIFDNAAMIASLGYFVAQKTPPTNPRTIEVQPTMRSFLLDESSMFLIDRGFR